jgi:hypothetical protein
MGRKFMRIVLIAAVNSLIVTGCAEDAKAETYPWCGGYYAICAYTTK